MSDVRVCTFDDPERPCDCPKDAPCLSFEASRTPDAATTRWLGHPVLLVDQPEDEVDHYAWIEATDKITADNAADEFKRQLPDAIISYHGEKQREALGVDGPRWHVPYHPDYDEGETPVPLDFETADLYFCERVTWREILLPATNAVPLWRIEWSPAE